MDLSRQLSWQPPKTIDVIHSQSPMTQFALLSCKRLKSHYVTKYYTPQLRIQNTGRSHLCREAKYHTEDSYLDIQV